MNQKEAVKAIENTELIMQALGFYKRFCEVIKNNQEAELINMAIKLIQAYEFLYNKPSEKAEHA